MPSSNDEWMNNTSVMYEVVAKGNNKKGIIAKGLN